MEHAFTANILVLSTKLDDMVNDNLFFVDECWAYDLWKLLEDELPALIDYLKHEYHQNHKIDPLIIHLRDKLESVVNESINFPMVEGDLYESAVESCDKWIEWIDRYYPQDPGDFVQVPATQQPKKKPSRAEIRLQSQELQEVRQELINAGLIVDGQWKGSPAEFGCLVLELHEFRGVGASRAWKDCTVWAGYGGSIKSARNAIEANPNTRGQIADKIRAICRAGSNARK